MDMETMTLVTLAWELHQQGMPTLRIAKQLGKHRETIGLWLAGIQQAGSVLAFIEHYHQAKRKPRPKRQVPISVKQQVWALREREEGCCGQKIAYFLEAEQGIKLSVPKIYEILAERYTLRSKGKQKNQKRGPVPQATAPRQVVQIDSIHLGAVFAFTAIDIYSREADVWLSGTLTGRDGALFLAHCMPRRFDGFVELIQTDGGAEFEAEFLEVWPTWCDRHRIARPYKKNEQSYIESFNRTFRSECLGWHKYQTEQIPLLVPIVEHFLDRYHYHRPHLAFEPMRPPLNRS